MLLQLVQCSCIGLSMQRSSTFQEVHRGLWSPDLKLGDLLLEFPFKGLPQHLCILGLHVLISHLRLLQLNPAA